MSILSKKITNNEYIYVDNLRRLLLTENLDASNVKLGQAVDTKDVRLFYLLRFPYLCLKNIFSVLFFETNRLTCMFISLNCLILTISDLIVFADFVRSFIAYDIFVNYIDIQSQLKLMWIYFVFRSDQTRLSYLLTDQALKTVSKLMLYGTFYAIYNVIPAFLVDMIFFYFVFFKIIFNFYELFGNVKSFAQSVTHYFARFF
jgi:hypothetical protein